MKNVKIIDKQLKLFCNDKHILDNFFQCKLWGPYAEMDNIPIADYIEDFLNEFKMKHFRHDKIDFAIFWGLNPDEYFNTIIQDLFEKKYIIEVEISINKLLEKENQEGHVVVCEIVSREIAIDKILRNKIYNLGLGLKLNMKSAGIT